MKNQTPSSGRPLRRAAISTLSAAVLFAAASVYAQSSSDSSSTSTRTGVSAPVTGSSMDSSAGSSSTGALRSSQASEVVELPRADRRFLTKAVELNIEEIRLSELAAQQATNPEVRAFAQQLVTEHTQASTELSNVASRKGLSASARDDYDQRAVTRLSKKTGADFDKAYIDKMVDAHDDAVDLFEKASRNAKDPDVQAVATKLLPKLQQHQQHAKSLEKSIK